MNKPGESEYQSYLLRLWRASKGNDWRVMLEQIGSHQRLGFANLDDLFAFLHAQTDPVSRPPVTPIEENNAPR